MSERYLNVEVDDSDAITLGTKEDFEGIKSAQVQVSQGAGQSDSTRVVSMRRDGGQPTIADGFLLGEGNIITLIGYELQVAKFRGLEAGVTHKLRVDLFADAA